MNRLVTLGRIRESMCGQMPKMIWDFFEQYVTQRGHCHQDRAMSILGQNFLPPSQSYAVLNHSAYGSGKSSSADAEVKTNCEVA